MEINEENVRNKISLMRECDPQLSKSSALVGAPVIYGCGPPFTRRQINRWSNRSTRTNVCRATLLHINPNLEPISKGVVAG
jgi:hypothetical protein